ncbi:beta-ketoacyl synthase N-terminal-like domain-containing protein [Nannocystis bainbridge]|uniref:Beta-ketoacyl synthase N-terminal-like domain-containing protein n=1 Tax=Nannocystis bainbridge TaxID=2995303 RepID=A0ABT5E5N8_9BACT|nr:beta-ketoacyl synthase N-terminal-like domain-containing protein [Nannocystis bainbridge]MDC0721161.1 beta-ketoacyl synthase N-terminal-like domain-containing protein [Nannocystis bainbridge]
MVTPALEPVAVVGLGCRFPGAPDPTAYWSLLRAGRHAIVGVPPSRWDAAALHDADPQRPGRTLCRSGGFLPEVDGIDWRALRLSPREARAIDPQHRLLLEVAWEALEDAGLPLEAVAGSRTGVFVGATWNDYARMQSRDRDRLDGYAAAGTPMAFAANRISFTFDLRGPSVALDATCSASLVALHQACQSLWSGDSTLALAGGVNLILAPDSAIIMSKAGVLSAQGLCRALDADADGFVRGEGAGLVVLKLRSQVTASDRVYAYVRGVAINHNGRGPWIMAPRAEAQTAAIRDALARAAVDPAEVDYVELHGTGFPQGDATETAALGAALGGAARGRPCAVGSVKTNIGNLEPAAGVASLIKVCLALHHGELPPTLHLERINPAIDLAGLGLAAQTETTAWPRRARARVAAVTTTSFSGVNAHAVLGEAEPAAALPAPRGLLPLPLSARDAQALRARAAATIEQLRGLESDDAAALRDVCFTAALLRSHHAHRVAVIGDSAPALADALARWLAGAPSANSTDSPANSADSPASTADSLATSADSPCTATGIEASELHRLIAAYNTGAAIDWRPLVPAGRCVSLPTYPWQRERMWLEWLATPPAVDAESENPEKIDIDASTGDDTVDPVIPPLLAALREASPGLRRARLLQHVEQALRAALELPADLPIGPHARLFDLGVSSLTALALRTRFQRELACELPPTLLFDHPSLDGLAGRLLAAAFPEPAADAPVDARARELAALTEVEAEAELARRLEHLRRYLP